MAADDPIDHDEMKRLRDNYACPCDESAMFDRFLLPKRASGMWVWVENDEEPYLDLVMGYSSLNFGHCHPEIVRFVNEAAGRLSQIHSFHTVQKLKLSKYLVDAVDPEGGYKVYFDIGGTGVVSSAMRLCRSYTNRKTVVSFEGAFHGAGYSPSSASDHRLLNEEQYGLGDKSAYIEKLPFPSRHGGVSVDRCIQMLEELIAREKPAAVIVEPIQGAAGFIIPHDDFLPRLREVTESAQIMLIVDEIQMGMGRAGYLYSFQHWGITPDIVLLSKSMSGGYFPLSAIIARSELFDNVSPVATAFQSTFNNNPFGIQIALQIMEMVDRENLYENARLQGGKLLEQLRFIEDSPFTANLRGHGMAIAFDVVDSRSSGRPARELARRFTNIALDEHLLVYACGVEGSVIKFAPMITIDDDDISIIVKKLRACFSAFNGSPA